MEQCISGHLARLRWTLAAMVGPEAVDSTVVREKWVEAGSVFIIRYQKIVRMDCALVSVCGYPVFSTPFIDDAILPLLSILESLSYIS